MKLSVTIVVAGCAALAACSQTQEQSVANQFNALGNSIENTAATLENETANTGRAIEQDLDNRAARLHNQADALENRIDAIDVVPGAKPGNQQ